MVILFIYDDDDGEADDKCQKFYSCQIKWEFLYYGYLI